MFARALPLLAVVASLGTTSACVPDFDTDLSELTEPRVVAIASSPAETQSTKPASLTALVAVPEGQQPPAVDWTMCLARKPLTELGPVSPQCFEPADGTTVLDLGRGETADALLDKDVCKLFGPQRPSPKDGDAAGRPADPDITGGFYQPFVARLGQATTLGSVRLDCDLANVDRDEAVNYRKRYRVNENPRITAISRVTDSAALEPITNDDAPLQLARGGATLLRASWDECSAESVCGDGLCTAFEDSTSCAEDCTGTLHGCTGAEPYVWYNRETEHVEPRREGVSVAWYASRGHFEHEQTGLDESQAVSQLFTENHYLAPKTAGPATIWLVIRDTRGGQSWEIRHLEVAP
jgi:hypothetical protein